MSTNSERPISENEFKACIASRLMSVTDIDETEATELAQSVLANHLELEGVSYGDPEHVWNKETAEIITDEELMCWG